ncbi:hypothetical protein KQH49_08950 [Mycetohabitans sp. B5]|uniref:Uncharacterized protein n=1 Tax=Mycetohabitans endofungorum TaxID=417203 RepID=A0A2P5K732_9BURK|nr:hypothetical protein [Mycetohabitans sp. B5]PPB81439.1 hypothetical protein B0O95_11912 [Mycetohabitans endofungorum]
MPADVQAKVPNGYGIPRRTDVPLAGKNGEARQEDDCRREARVGGLD